MGMITIGNASGWLGGNNGSGISICKPQKAYTQTKIGDLLVDAVLSRETTLDSEVTENPVEDGFCVADHVVRKPIKLSLECIFTPTPITWSNSGGRFFKLQSVAQALEKIYKAGEPITVETSDAIYTDMVMTHAPLPRSIQDGIMYKMSIDFVHVRLVKQKTAEKTDAEAEGKSGESEINAGTASQKDICTGMTMRGGTPSLDMDATAIDTSASGSISTGNVITANRAAISIAAALGSGASAGSILSAITKVGV